jgi:hypothetical protein
MTDCFPPPVVVTGFAGIHWNDDLIIPITNKNFRKFRRIKWIFKSALKGFFINFQFHTSSILVNNLIIMIDKNFYLENLSAFDILIQDDREQAEKVIFRVFSILQRDKIWLRDVATEEEIFEEDAELLEEVEEELQELDQKYDFGFEAFYQRVQLELKKIQATSDLNLQVAEDFTEDEDLEEEDLDFIDEEEEEDPDLYEEEEEDEDDFEDEDDLFDESESDALSHISDEELDQITDYILESAKTRFDYAEFLDEFSQVDELFVEENILFPIIAGKAHEETDYEIAAKMNSAFLISGFQMSIEDLQEMTEQKGHELGLEILAFGIAADSLQQGANPAEVLHQISQLLKS